MRKRPILAVVAALVALLLAASASAANFSPTTKFKLSNTKPGANPSLTVSVAQEEGEEEIKAVSLVIPGGFSVPGDEKIQDGDQLGEGQIDIMVGPACAGAPAGGLPFSTSVSIIERDRTDEEKAQGVVAVWVVDLRPVTTIDLLIKGSKARGWQLLGEVPANDFTCPPFTFAATLFDKTAEGKVPLFMNTAKPGAYVFQAIFEGEEGAKYVQRQTVRIK